MGGQIPELRISRYLSDTQKLSFGACVSYDESLKIKDLEECLDDLAGAIWRYVYKRNENVDEKYPVMMANYVLQEVLSLSSVPPLALLEGRLEWSEPPEFPSRPDGFSYKTNALDKKKQAEKEVSLDIKSPSEEAFNKFSPTDVYLDQKGDWRMGVAIDGKEFFWNMRTLESRHSIPTNDARVKISESS